MTDLQMQSIAQKMDNDDVLAIFSNEFDHGDCIYLDGNSLGKKPKATQKRLLEIVEKEWGLRLIRSWNEKWLKLAPRISKKIAGIVGAQPDEIFVGDNTTINLYKLCFGALSYNTNKNEILTDNQNFPTDYYVVQGLIENQFKNHRINKVSVEPLAQNVESTIGQNLSNQTALVYLSHVLYKSGFKYNMQTINSLAKQNNSLTLWDLSHATGAVPLQLSQWEADLAVGCTYKYLNGGPGAPAFVYVRKELQSAFQNPVWGWFAHESPFSFDENFNAISSINKMATGTPQVLSLAAIEPSLDIFLQAGLPKITQKSERLTGFFIEMYKERLQKLGFTLETPTASNSRGSHISLGHTNGYQITQALIDPAVDAPVIIPDFRPPNIIRFGFAALYNSFTDICNTVLRLEQIILTKEYEHKSAIIQGVS